MSFNVSVIYAQYLFIIFLFSNVYMESSSWLSYYLLTYHILNMYLRGYLCICAKLITYIILLINHYSTYCVNIAISIYVCVKLMDHELVKLSYAMPSRMNALQWSALRSDLRTTQDASRVHPPCRRNPSTSSGALGSPGGTEKKLFSQWLLFRLSFYRSRCGNRLESTFLAWLLIYALLSEALYERIDSFIFSSNFNIL